MEKEEIERALSALGDELARRDVRAKIFLVGGAAMVLAFRARSATADVEADVYPPEDVLQAADTVGAHLGLPAGWLNNDAKIYLPLVGPTSFTPVRRFGVLEVVAADAQTMLAMKLRASRGRRDETDIRFLVERLQMGTAQAVYQLYEEFFPEDPLPERARLIVEELFGK